MSPALLFEHYKPFYRVGMVEVVVCTIGFSKKNLRDFISRLQSAGVKKVIDVRLNNTSQLAGYAKKEDLEYVLSLVDINYEHLPELAPTEELLANIKNKKITWTAFEKEFINILAVRDPDKKLAFQQEKSICLLCSEDEPARCHRRLIAEYYFKDRPEMIIKHL